MLGGIREKSKQPGLRRAKILGHTHTHTHTHSQSDVSQAFFTAFSIGSVLIHCMGVRGQKSLDRLFSSLMGLGRQKMEFRVTNAART